VDETFWRVKNSRGRRPSASPGTGWTAKLAGGLTI